MTDEELDAIEARAKRIAGNDWNDPINYDREGFPPDIALALIAEVRRLQAKLVAIIAIERTMNDLGIYETRDQ